MRIEQTIINAVEVSRLTRIPVLFMSNPGLGKTTILKRYAAQHKLHLETLIGSRFTPEEISGYQVNNGGDHLTHLNPEWFNRIKEKSAEGIKTLLFVDELSTCSEFVQGALLSLIFDRSIGNGKMLPADCLIVAAANYAGNLPGTMAIMAPTLNRFIIINLNEGYDAFEMLDEFVEQPLPATYPVPVKKMTPQSASSFRETFHNAWKEIFIKYSDSTSALGLLDISNQNLDGLYSESNGSVYNFVSGRSISYLSRALIAYLMLDLHDEDFLHKMVDGLVGAGTCLFTDQQAEKYRNTVHERIEKIVLNKDYFSQTGFVLVHGINRDITLYLSHKDDPNYTIKMEGQHLFEIEGEIREKYDISNFMQVCKTEVDRATFISEMDSMLELIKYLRRTKKAPNIAENIEKICLDFYGFYCDVMGSKPDYVRRFGQECRAFERTCFVRVKINGKEKITRAALYNPNISTMLPKLYLMGEKVNIFQTAQNNYLGRELCEVLAYDEEQFRFVSMKRFTELLRHRWG